MTAQLTAHDFNGVRKGGVSFVELEDGDILAYGHIEPALMAEAVGRWFTEDVDPGNTGPGALRGPEPSEVLHVWGVAVAGPPGSDEGPYVRLEGVTQWTPGAVPVTLVRA